MYQQEEIQQKTRKCHPERIRRGCVKDLSVSLLKIGDLEDFFYRLINKIPAKIVTIPANCQREMRSRRKIAASPTVTAP